MYYYLKFIVYHFLIFIVMIVFAYYWGDYLSPPFTFVDLLAGIVGLTIFRILFGLISKVFQQFDTISSFKKVILTIMSFICSVLVVGIIGGIQS